MCGERGVVEKLAAKWAPGDNFGLWGACMRVGIDSAEWSLVRQQVRSLSDPLSLSHSHSLSLSLSHSLSLSLSLSLLLTCQVISPPQALLVLVALSALCHKHNLWEQLLTCRNEEVHVLLCETTFHYVWFLLSLTWWQVF